MGETTEVEVFNKGPFEGEPSAMIQELAAKLAVLGPAVIAARDADGRFSGNFSKVFYVGKDGKDFVIGGKGSPLGVGECTCHIHINWNRICGHAFRQEDVGLHPSGLSRQQLWIR